MTEIDVHNFIRDTHPKVISYALLALYLAAVAFIVQSKVARWFTTDSRRSALRKSSALIFTALLTLLGVFWMTLLQFKIAYGYAIPSVTHLFIICAFIMTFAMTVFIESFASSLKSILGPAWVRWLEYPYVVLGLLGLYRALSDSNDPTKDPDGAFLAPLLLVMAASVKITKVNIEVGLSAMLRKAYRRIRTEVRKQEKEEAAVERANQEKWKEAESQPVSERRLARAKEFAKQLLALEREEKLQMIRLYRFVDIIYALMLVLCIAVVVVLFKYIDVPALIAGGALWFTIEAAIWFFLRRRKRVHRIEHGNRLSAWFDTVDMSRAETLALIEEYTRNKDETRYISNFDELMRSHAEQLERGRNAVVPVSEAN